MATAIATPETELQDCEHLEFGLAAADVAALFSATAFVACNEYQRYALGYVKLSISHDSIVALATDGKRLALRQTGPPIGAVATDGPQEVYIDRKLAQQLAAINPKTTGAVRFWLVDKGYGWQGTVTWRNKRRERVEEIRPLEGRFPRVTDILQSARDLAPTASITGTAGEILAALPEAKNADVWTLNPSRKRFERFHRIDGSDRPRCKHPSKAIVSGEIQVAFDVELLRQWLKTIPEEQAVAIWFSNPDSLFCGIVNGNLRYLQMPCSGC